MQEAALTSTALYDPYRSFADHKQSLTSQIKSRIEYLISSGDIIVLVRLFNLTMSAVKLRHHWSWSILQQALSD